MKLCNTCKEQKEYDQYSKDKKRLDGLSNKCRACTSKYTIAYRIKNPDSRGDTIEARKRKRNRRRRKIVEMMAELKSLPCTDCKNTFPPVCMDFDHIRGTKLFNLSAAGSRAGSWHKIAQEVAKCDLVCANCHRIRTQIRAGRKV